MTQNASLQGLRFAAKGVSNVSRPLSSLGRLLLHAAWVVPSVVLSGYLYLTGLVGAFSPIFYPLSVVCALWLVIKIDQVAKNINSWLPIAFFLVSLVPGIFGAAESEYGDSKLLALAVICLLIILPAGIRFLSEFLSFYFAFVVFLTGLLSVRIVFEAAVQSNGTIQLETLNAIHSGRAVMYGAVLSAVFALSSKVNLRFRGLALVVSVVLTGVGFAIGSRGPVLAAAAAVTIILLVQFSQSGRNRAAIAMGVVAAASILLALFDAQDTRLASGDGSGRDVIYAHAMSVLVQSPVGIGWGGYPDTPGSEPYSWPHNIFLEVGIEGGWLVLVSLSLLLTAALRRSFSLMRRDDSTLPSLAFSSVVFFAVAALFSADLSGNLLLFSSIGIALSCSEVRLRETEQAGAL